jgi:hypothetical protein
VRAARCVMPRTVRRGSGATGPWSQEGEGAEELEAAASD